MAQRLDLGKWIMSFAHDPVGGGLKIIIPDALRAFFVLPESFAHVSMAQIPVKQKTRSKLRVWDDDFGGERGIRTPGPTIAGQRFSRPPHSTALPFLPSSTVALAKVEFVRRSFSEGGIRSAAKIILFSFFRIFR